MRVDYRRRCRVTNSFSLRRVPGTLGDLWRVWWAGDPHNSLAVPYRYVYRQRHADALRWVTDRYYEARE